MDDSRRSRTKIQLPSLAPNKKGATRSRPSSNRTENEPQATRRERPAISQLLVKLATRAGNINPPGHAPLAILRALHNARFFAALGAGSRFAGVHDLLTVGCFCDLRHLHSPDRNVPPARGRGSTWCLGSNWNAGVRHNGRVQNERASVLAASSLHEMRGIGKFRAPYSGLVHHPRAAAQLFEDITADRFPNHEVGSWFGDAAESHCTRGGRRLPSLPPFVLRPAFVLRPTLVILSEAKDLLFCGETEASIITTP